MTARQRRDAAGRSCSGRLGGLITRSTTGFFRSGLAGQANAILLAPGLEPLEHRSLRIDDRPARAALRARRSGSTELVGRGNLHATNELRATGARRRRVVRAEAFVDRARRRAPCRPRGRLQSPCGAPARARRAGRRAGRASTTSSFAGSTPSPLVVVATRAPRVRMASCSRITLRSRFGRMTFEEARALFPVLERVAYLNAGTFGPLARPTLDGDGGRAARETLSRAGRACRTSSACSRSASEVRERLAALVGVEPDAGRADQLDDGRLQHRPRRPRPRARGRGRDDRPTSTSASSGRCTRAVPRVVVAAPDAGRRSSRR